MRYMRILASLSVTSKASKNISTSVIEMHIIQFAFLQIETALVYDAVHLFARAMTDLDRSQEVSEFKFKF